jgi:hypothetical protein
MIGEIIYNLFLTVVNMLVNYSPSQQDAYKDVTCVAVQRRIKDGFGGFKHPHPSEIPKF